MITDIFYKRYPNVGYFPNGVPRHLHVFFRQGAQIVFDDLAPHVNNIENVCNKAYTKLIREIGHGLFQANSAKDICMGALYEVYDLWNDAHGSATDFVKYRFSLIELLFSEIEFNLIQDSANKSIGIGLFKKKTPETNIQSNLHQDAYQAGIQELNHRLRESDLPFHFHNGLFQYNTDQLSETVVYEPFWKILKDQKWTNVDLDIKEAMDRKDNNGRDVVLYALKALESTIKIISDDKGWSSGKERGAANYIDNLVSTSNGRFIDVWESEMLKALFRDLRNPHGHGPGSAPQPNVSEQQKIWAIECSMIWIKSLISRL